MRLCFFLSSCQYVFSSRTSSPPSRTLIFPKGPKQQQYMDALMDKKIPMVVAHGPAGCGKTLLACDAFVRSYQQGLVSKMILTRPSVSVEGEQLGFLPGSMQEKMSPWTQPVFDILLNYFTGMELKSLVEVVPLGFIRGRTFHRSFVLGDEMQNATPSQWLTLVSRLGLDSKIVLTGDLLQSDLVGSVNGLAQFVAKDLKKPFGSCRTIALDGESVCRSPLVRDYLSWHQDP